MTSSIENLITLMAKLPGLGPRSARRMVLHLIRRREKLLQPLLHALREVEEHIKTCHIRGNLDSSDPCGICCDGRRDASVICVVEDVADLWAMERSKMYKGTYHVLGGVLSAVDGVGPDRLSISGLLERARSDKVKEIILATNATVDGQTTAHYLRSPSPAWHRASQWAGSWIILMMVRSVRRCVRGCLFRLKWCVFGV
jgi:recombination protein RecR